MSTLSPIYEPSPHDYIMCAKEANRIAGTLQGLNTPAQDWKDEDDIRAFCKSIFIKLNTI